MVPPFPKVLFIHRAPLGRTDTCLSDRSDSHSALKPSVRQQALSSCLSLTLSCFILTHSKTRSRTITVLTPSSPFILHRDNHLHFKNMFLNVLAIFSLQKSLPSFHHPGKSLNGTISSISQRLLCEWEWLHFRFRTP